MLLVHTLTEGQIKTLRGSYNREDRASTAYVSSNELVLRQLKIEQKSNEITVIPEQIKMLDIKSVIDVMVIQDS